MALRNSVEQEAEEERKSSIRVIASSMLILGYMAMMLPVKRLMLDRLVPRSLSRSVLSVKELERYVGSDLMIGCS